MTHVQSAARRGDIAAPPPEVSQPGLPSCLVGCGRLVRRWPGRERLILAACRISTYENTNRGVRNKRVVHNH